MTIIEDSAFVGVRSIASCPVSYQIPEDHRRVVFQPGEAKKITAGELRKLYFKPGGDIILREFLNLDSQELREEFGIPDDVPEYEWTAADVKRLMDSGSIDELKDALEFGPQAIQDAIVDYAIANRIPNSNKRKAIEEMTGIHVDQAIRLREEADAALGVKDEPEPKKTRRVQSKSVASSRRVKKDSNEQA